MSHQVELIRRTRVLKSNSKAVLTRAKSPAAGNHLQSAPGRRLETRKWFPRRLMIWTLVNKDEETRPLPWVLIPARNRLKGTVRRQQQLFHPPWTGDP